MKIERENITSEQIRLALKKFESEGGLVRTLPPQDDPARRLVGGHYAIFEDLFEAVGMNLI